MDYCIVNAEGMIENMIAVDDEAFAAEIGALPGYEGALIGGLYVPPAEPESEPELTTEQRLTELEEAFALLLSGATGETEVAADET